MRTLGWWMLAWVALGALWLLYQGEWNAITIYAAVSAGALSLVVALLLVRKRTLPAARLEWRWFTRAAQVPWKVVREFALITLFLVRRPRRQGEFREVPFPTGGARPAERGRRAWVALATGYSPNSYVVDVDEERGVVLVHVLSPVAPGQELF
jgi:multisubunit Na+/H+ antiporter MnhE subunit